MDNSKKYAHIQICINNNIYINYDKTNTLTWSPEDESY